MIKPVEMRKVMILATKAAESRLISALHACGMMEIRTLEVPGLEKGKPLHVHDAVSHELVRVRGLMNAFSALPFLKGKPVAARKAREPDYDSALVGAGSIKIDAELKELVEARARLVTEAAELSKENAEISSISYFSNIDFSKLQTKTFTFALGKVKKKVSAAFLKDLGEYLNKNAEIITAAGEKDDDAVLVFYPRKENLDFVLSRYNFEKIQLPENFSTLSKGVSDIESALAQNRKGTEDVEKRISALANANLPELVRLEKELSILSARASVATKFATGGKIIALEGWIKRRDAKALSGILDSGFAAEAEMVDLGEGDDAPIVLDNPKQISQFQWLVEFYSLPAYAEFDPTFLLLFTVPIIYGMIVGDVGYGLMSIPISLLILKKYKGGMLGNIAKIWLFSAASAIVFGIVFDEWFGFSHLHLAEFLASWGLNLGITHSLYTGISRSTQLSLVIGITLLVGVVHLSMGLILGAINAWHHDKKHAAARITWLALLLSGSTAVAAMMFNLVPASFGTPALAVFGLCVLAIAYLEGLPGIFEIPGIAANTFSYARIAAAGVAGVIIAEIINDAFLPTPARGLVMLPIFILLHILNAGLAMFESIVQGGRLNLVEFYSKFFQGGGKAFDPFAMRKGDGDVSAEPAGQGVPDEVLENDENKR